MRYRYLLAVLTIFAAASFVSADAPPATSLPKPPAKKPMAAPMQKPPAAETLKPIPGYDVTFSPADIAPTIAGPFTEPPKVYGEPRTTIGHPCTLWDKEDIAHYQAMLKTSKTMQDAFAKLKDAMDKRITEPLNVPEPKKDANGEWMYLGDEEQYKTAKDGGKPVSYYHVNENNVGDISDLGTMYALTGDAKYGDFAKKMLLAYADGYPKFGHGRRGDEPWTEKGHRSEFDGRMTGQFLEDGLWLIQAARGYDLVYNLPSWTPDERKQIRDGLFEAIAAEFTDPIISDRYYTDQAHNRSVIATAGVLMAGYASDDEKLINTGLYGESADKEKPSGGVFGIHFTNKCISPDGMWNEGAMGYQNMALSALVDDAETLWHHGYNMYSYNNSILKHLFDSEILFTYPDLTFPSTHDSGRFSIIPTEAWNDDGPHSFEYGYLRYHDPRYLAPVTPLHLTLRQSIHDGPTSVLFDQDLDKKPPITNSESVNFYDIGYGILRLDAKVSPVSLLFQCGQSRSHGHPDKLSIDLYGLGDVISPDPGVIFPYYAKLDVQWYWTTPGHATVTVDEKPQMDFANRYQFPKTLPGPDATQLVYGPASTMGIERGYSDTVYPGVTQDRALFLTPDYVADIFGTFSNESHTYDNAWHLRGEMATAMALQPFKFPQPVAEGYNALTDTKHISTKDAFGATVTLKDHPVRLLAAGGTDTEVITGGGWYRYGPTKDESVPAIFERRIGNSTVFGNALDISGGKEPYVKSVSQEGGLDAGYAVLKVETVKGTDVCLSAFRPGTYKAAGIETDAMQAFVLNDGANVRAMYLGGGKMLKEGDASIERSEPGLAYVEKMPDGDYVVVNASPTAATITVNLPGQTKGPAVIAMKAGEKQEFTK